MYFWDVPPVFNLYSACISPYILGILLNPCIYLQSSNFAAGPLYPAVSHCIQLYLAVSSLYLTVSHRLEQTGYGQKYTPGEGYLNLMHAISISRHVTRQVSRACPISYKSPSHIMFSPMWTDLSCKTINRSHAHRTQRQRKHPRHRHTHAHDKKKRCAWFGSKIPKISHSHTCIYTRLKLKSSPSLPSTSVYKL